MSNFDRETPSWAIQWVDFNNTSATLSYWLSNFTLLCCKSFCRVGIFRQEWCFVLKTYWVKQECWKFVHLFNLCWNVPILLYVVQMSQYIKFSSEKWSHLYWESLPRKFGFFFFFFFKKMKRIAALLQLSHQAQSEETGIDTACILRGLNRFCKGFRCRKNRKCSCTSRLGFFVWWHFYNFFLQRTINL